MTGEPGREEPMRGMRRLRFKPLRLRDLREVESLNATPLANSAPLSPRLESVGHRLP